MSTSLTIGSSSKRGKGNRVSLVEPGDDTILIVREMGSSDEPLHRFGLRVPDTLDVSVGLMAADTHTVTGTDGGAVDIVAAFDGADCDEPLVLGLCGLRQPLHLHSKQPFPST